MMVTWKKERRKCLSSIGGTLYWNFVLCFALVLSATMIVYVQDFVLIITLLMTLTIIAFCVGRPFYRYRRTGRNPLTQILQVLIAAVRKKEICLILQILFLLYEVQSQRGPKKAF